ncbi:MAG: hypothetical protein UMU75_09670 [Halomonas sp.]|nr:hypothetical protein [Halomonas sp.]
MWPIYRAAAIKRDNTQDAGPDRWAVVAEYGDGRYALCEYFVSYTGAAARADAMNRRGSAGTQPTAGSLVSPG